MSAYFVEPDAFPKVSGKTTIEWSSEPEYTFASVTKLGDSVSFIPTATGDVTVTAQAVIKRLDGSKQVLQTATKELIVSASTTEEPKPDPTITLDGPAESKVGEGVTYTATPSEEADPAKILWAVTTESGESVPSTLSADRSSITFTLEAEGKLQISVSVETRDGRTASETTTLTVGPKDEPNIEALSLQLTVPSTAIQGELITAKFAAGDTVDPTKTVWTISPGNYEPTYSAENSQVTFTASQVGDITVTVSAETEDGRKASAEGTVKVSEKPTPTEKLSAEITGPTTATIGSSVTLKATANKTIDPDKTVWKTTPAYPMAYDKQAGTMTFTPTVAGTVNVDVSVATADGETAKYETYQVQASQPAAPTKLSVTITGPKTATVGSSVTLTATANKTIDPDKTVWKTSPAYPSRRAP